MLFFTDFYELNVFTDFMKLVSLITFNKSFSNLIDLIESFHTGIQFLFKDYISQKVSKSVVDYSLSAGKVRRLFSLCTAVSREVNMGCPLTSQYLSPKF